MKAVTYDYARNHLDEIFDMVEIQSDGVIIVKSDKNFVLMDKDFLESIFETAELTKDKDFVSSLRTSQSEMEKGESFTFEEVFGEKI